LIPGDRAVVVPRAPGLPLAEVRLRRLAVRRRLLQHRRRVGEKGAALLYELRSGKVLGAVLRVVAHPPVADIDAADELAERVADRLVIGVVAHVAGARRLTVLVGVVDR